MEDATQSIDTISKEKKIPALGIAQVDKPHHLAVRKINHGQKFEKFTSNSQTFPTHPISHTLTHTHAHTHETTATAAATTTTTTATATTVATLIMS